jgi:hypothetical protein
MPDRREELRPPSGGDRVLLILSGLLALSATARGLGTDGIAPSSVTLLSLAAVLALRPIIRIASARGSGRVGRRTLLAAVFSAHMVATLFFFPPEDILNSRPVITLDHALHYQQAERARDVFRKSLRLHAYDPYFMAGYPGGTVFDIDSKGMELWCSLMPLLGTARAYKLFILIAYMLLVPLAYSGCRRLGYSYEESLMSVLLLLAFWHWGRPYAGEFRYAGMFSYLAVSLLSLYITGLARPFLRGERVRRLPYSCPCLSSR